MPNYELAARRAAKKYGVDPDIFVAQLRQESGLKPGLTSSAGAQGIAQFIPSTAKQYGVNLSDGRVSDDLDGAARYMRDNLDRTGEDYKAALSIYNSGRPDAYKDPNFAQGQTYNYVNGILKAAKVKAPKASTASPTAKTTSQQVVSTPGVDNAPLRKQLVRDFLGAGGVKNQSAVLGLAGQYGQAADIPGSAQTTTDSSGLPTSISPSIKGGSRVLELIFNDGGKGYGIKDGRTVNGSQVYGGVWAGHANHVHVAAGPKTIVRLGKLAESMGLHVGENPHFGGVDPVHVQGSYHYKGEAIDVSGPEKLMAAFARKVAAYNQSRKLPSATGTTKVKAKTTTTTSAPASSYTSSPAPASKPATAPKPKVDTRPTLKERLFAHPLRPNAQHAGGDNQVRVHGKPTRPPKRKPRQAPSDRYSGGHI